MPYPPEVLLYHRVVDDSINSQYLSVSPENFEMHLDIIRSERKIMPLFDLVTAATKGHLIEDGISITFDDGYADNLLNALPLLEKYRCHATIFVTAGLLGHPYGFWYDVLEDLLLTGRDLPEKLVMPVMDEPLPLNSAENVLITNELLLDSCKTFPERHWRALLEHVMRAIGLPPHDYKKPHPLLTKEQLLELAASPWIEIGAHTLTHPVLSQLDEEAQRREIVESVRTLEDLIGKPVRILAYPFGNKDAYNDITKKVTREAGLLGIANIQGSLSLENGPLDLQDVPRRLVRDWTGAEFRRWLRSADKHRLESKTVGGRSGKLVQLIREGAPIIERSGVKKTEHPLHIAHINTMLGKGGTAGVMQLLTEIQGAGGHSPNMLVGRSHALHAYGATFAPVPQEKLKAALQQEGLTDYHFQGSHSLEQFPALQKADVLHFHNLHGDYFNPWSLPALSRLRPSVWTLHDMHALTGHCAHAFDCPRWRTGCGLCPDLQVYPATPVDNTHRMWRDKQRMYACSPVHVVTPSRWLASHVEKSMLADHPLTVIPNGIDTTIFTPGDKEAVRARLGIAPGTLVVGSAAYNGPLHNFWKGGSFAMEALEALRAVYPDVLFLGRGNAEEMNIPNVRLMPYAFNEGDMAEFYSALDLMLYPSLADNCPLVVMEAMACGVPVLSFGVGGIPELVDEDSGVLVEPRDSEALCYAAVFLAEHAQLRQHLGHAARQKAVSCFDARLMAQRYETLYVEVRENWQKLPQARNCMNPAEVPPQVRTKTFEAMAQRTRLWGGADIAAATAGDTASPANETENAFRAEPLSRSFGLDRPGGQPVDRVYIERFLSAHAKDIHGRVMEVAANTYSQKFGCEVTQCDILHAKPTADATLVGDLATGAGIPKDAFDCIILTQTVQFIYAVKEAMTHAVEALAPGGVLLLTASGISQISRYDMDRWGEFWRFTDKALERMLREAAPHCTVEVQAFGNAGTARAFLDGRSAAELPPVLFEQQDHDYQVTLCARVVRPKVHVMPKTPSAKETWTELTVPDDMAGLYEYAREHRHGRFRVRFQGLTIHCIDLLSFYMAGKDIFVQGIYDFSSKSTAPFVIDGGAHIGLFTLRVKQLYPEARILAFEPDEQARSLFMLNLHANGHANGHGGDKNNDKGSDKGGVDVVPAGLHDSDGVLPFSSRGDDGNTLFGASNNTSVRVTRLSRHLQRPVDFLKLNIEGGEWPVLAECADLLPNVAQIVLEYHGFPELGDRLHNILDLLHKRGYRYMIHDFDAQTNPATKPPFRFDAGTRYFLLVAARRIQKTLERI